MSPETLQNMARQFFLQVRLAIPYKNKPMVQIEVYSSPVVILGIKGIPVACQYNLTPKPMQNPGLHRTRTIRSLETTFLAITRGEQEVT